MIAVVTGASRGIGAATASLLAEDGWNVLRLDRSHGCDVRKPEQIVDWFDRIKGGPLVLVNNAGTVEPGPIESMTIHDWWDTLDTCLTGTFMVTREFLRIAGPNPKIINVASTAGTRPSPGLAAYGAAKAGIINLSLSLSEELRGRARVYCIAPGRTATALRAKLAPDEEPASIMQPEEVGLFIRELVRDGNRLDGQVLTVR